MNKSFYLCAVAALALASCSNDETVETAKQNAIGFRSVVGLNSRAVETTTADLDEIKVTAFKADGSVYQGLQEILFTKDGGFFNSETPYYWPKDENEPLSFTAFSLEWNGTKAITSSTDIKVNDVHIDEGIEGQGDMVYVTGVTGTKKTNETSGVALEFKHALSQIQISAKSSSAAYSYEVKGIRIANVNSKANFDVVAGTWGNLSEVKTYDMQYNTPKILASDAQSIMDVAKVGGSDNAMLLPQGATTAWNAATDKENASKGTYISVLLSIKSKADNSNIYPKDGGFGWAAVPVSFTWEMGKKYIYTLDFTNGAGKVDPENPGPSVVQPQDPGKGEDILGEPIKFTVKVLDWTNEDVSTPMN